MSSHAKQHALDAGCRHCSEQQCEVEPDGQADGELNNTVTQYHRQNAVVMCAERRLTPNSWRRWVTENDITAYMPTDASTTAARRPRSRVTTRLAAGLESSR